MKRGRKPNLDKINLAKELRAKGNSYRKIAKLMGITDVKTVWRYVKYIVG